MSRKIESLKSHKEAKSFIVMFKNKQEVLNIFKYLIIFLTLDDTEEFEKIKLHQQLLNNTKGIDTFLYILKTHYNNNPNRDDYMKNTSYLEKQNSYYFKEAHRIIFMLTYNLSIDKKKKMLEFIHYWLPDSNLKVNFFSNSNSYLMKETTETNKDIMVSTEEQTQITPTNNQIIKDNIETTGDVPPTIEPEEDIIQITQDSKEKKEELTKSTNEINQDVRETTNLKEDTKETVQEINNINEDIIEPTRSTKETPKNSQEKKEELPKSTNEISQDIRETTNIKEDTKETVQEINNINENIIEPTRSTKETPKNSQEKKEELPKSTNEISQDVRETANIKEDTKEIVQEINNINEDIIEPTRSTKETPKNITETTNKDIVEETMNKTETQQQIKKKKILCLHGRRQSSDNFKEQISDYILELSDFEFIFANSPFKNNLWYQDIPRGGETGEDSDKNWANKSIMYLKKIIKRHEPYAVMAYSEGVSMILAYLSYQKDKKNINKFQHLILCNGYLPEKHLGLYNSIKSNKPYSQNTLICLDVKDPFYNLGLQIKYLFPNYQEIVSNNYGYDIPLLNNKEFDKIVYFIKNGLFYIDDHSSEISSDSEPEKIYSIKHLSPNIHLYMTSYEEKHKMILGEQNNDDFSYQEDIQYGLSRGNYILSNIYSDFPVSLFIRSNQRDLISFSGECHKKKEKDIDGVCFDFYHGDISINVFGDFGTITMFSLSTEDVTDQVTIVYTEESFSEEIETPETTFTKYRNIFLNNYLTQNNFIETIENDGFSFRMTDMTYSIERDDKENYLILKSNGVPNYIPETIGLNLLGNPYEINPLQTLKFKNNKRSLPGYNYYKNVYFPSTNFKIPLIPQTSNINEILPSGIVGVALNGIPLCNPGREPLNSIEKQVLSKDEQSEFSEEKKNSSLESEHCVISDSPEDESPKSEEIELIPDEKKESSESQDESSDNVKPQLLKDSGPKIFYHYKQFPLFFSKERYCLWNSEKEKCDEIDYLVSHGRHSSIVGFALDGFPIYGPVGYLTKGSDIKCAIMRSSYTGELDVNGNPTYISGSGDLDDCNGLVGPTPEFPNGIYHYHMTIQSVENLGEKVRRHIDPNFGYDIRYILGVFFLSPDNWSDDQEYIDSLMNGFVLNVGSNQINISGTKEFDNFYDFVKNLVFQLNEHELYMVSSEFETMELSYPTTIIKFKGVPSSVQDYHTSKQLDEIS